MKHRCVMLKRTLWKGSLNMCHTKKDYKRFTKQRCIILKRITKHRCVVLKGALYKGSVKKCHTKKDYKRITKNRCHTKGLYKGSLNKDVSY